MIQIGHVDPGTMIWRYLTFKKFVSLVELRALWFAKLGLFEDAEEGTVPTFTRQKIKSQHDQMERWFIDEERKSQVRRFVEDNEQHGRDLIVASCWFISNCESNRMWAEYAKDDEGVAIKSTVQAFTRSLVQSLKDKWWIGRVMYVDLSNYEGMDAYAGHQAHLRAFIKGMKYSHENELRVATMNFVAFGCLNPEGSPPNEKQRKGYIDASNGPGIYVRADLSTLINEVHTAPGASESHREKIKYLLNEAGVRVPVHTSEHDPKAALNVIGSDRRAV